jgi:hypothetical protein
MCCMANQFTSLTLSVLVAIVRAILTRSVLGFKVVGLALLFTLQISHDANGMEAEQPEHAPLQAAFEHFDQDKELIHQLLNGLEAELHFYWTTGKTLNYDKSQEYGADEKVDIGGTTYGQKFFPYSEKLLEVSPANLKIVLTCDELTEDSNKDQIDKLKNKFTNRFKILDVFLVEMKLGRHFPKQKEKISLVFANAVGGLPVLTSDVFRFIAMMFGQYQPSMITPRIAKKQYSYCDIDLFCGGMEGSSHEYLIRALFEHRTKTPFYIGVNNGMYNFNNDLVKIYIGEDGIESYTLFCINILNRIRDYKGVVTHYVKLHEIIKKCESQEECSTNIDDFSTPLVKDIVNSVTIATGPKFIEYVNMLTKDLDYPLILEGGWYPPEDVLDWHNMRTDYRMTHPRSVLYWGIGDATPEEQQASQLFDNECDHYRQVLGSAFFAKRFGTKHPFNQIIRSYLHDHYPYNSGSFKDLLKVNFKYYQTRPEKISYEEWKKEALGKVLRTGNHYSVLRHLLTELGIDFPKLTEENIDFIKAQIM